MWHTKNITLELKILIGHFTGVQKIITLSLIILMLSLANITSTSALSYQTETDISFTFNPTISISLSSSDLVISNLTPGTTSDSNDIVVSVSTNATYGYTLSVEANSDNLVHSNNSNVFSSIDTDASLSSLTVDNTWGYSYKNNLAPTPTWSNYSGLSTSTSKVLFNTDSNTSSSIGFKIGAKASSTQASGEYTNTINFIAISKPIPKTIEDIAYMQTFGELNTTDLASVKDSMVLNQDYILKDIRDEKEYYVTRLEDGNVWMTQNLDLDINSSKTYTYYDTDLGWTTNDTTATWQPATSHSTIDFSGDIIDDWVGSNTEPYSANPGNIYYYTSNSATNDTVYNSLLDCINSNHTNCEHYHAGNYYNWSASVASNDTSSLVSGDASNSICPAGWRLPKISADEFGILMSDYQIMRSATDNRYNSNGFNNIRKEPLYFIRSGEIDSDSKTVTLTGQRAYYWSSTIRHATVAHRFDFNNEFVYPAYLYGSYKNFGFSVRCLAR